mgnify:CR=1 FL=1
MSMSCPFNNRDMFIYELYCLLNKIGVNAANKRHTFSNTTNTYQYNNFDDIYMCEVFPNALNPK